MAIARDGFVFVPRCIDDATLQALRAEADSLFRLKRANDALSEDEYFDKVRSLTVSPDRLNRSAVFLRLLLCCAAVTCLSRVYSVRCKRWGVWAMEFL